MAERARFELAAPGRVTGFQVQLLKPLGHLSVAFMLLPVCNVDIIPHYYRFVKGFFKKKEIYMKLQQNCILFKLIGRQRIFLTFAGSIRSQKPL